MRRVLILAVILGLTACHAHLNIPGTPGAPKFRTNMSAFRVIGQADFVSNQSNQGLSTPNASTLAAPEGVYSDGSTNLIISDRSNHRVLVYSPFPTANVPAASVVIGQPDFSTATAGTCHQNDLVAPGDIFFNGSELLITYQGAGFGRLLGWNGIPFINQSNASLVFGHPDYVTCATQPVSDSSLKAAYDLGVGATPNQIFIADRGYNRISIFDYPFVNGMSSSVVVGQTDANSSTSGSGPNKLNSPQGVWSDGRKLIVADSANNRVLIYNSIPTSDGESASVVIGQPDFSGTLANAGNSSPDCSTLSNPTGIYSDGKTLFIGNAVNGRVLIFNSIPTQNRAVADVVIGQAGCTGNLPNQGGAAAANT